VKTKNNNHPRSEKPKNLASDELLSILRVHEVHFQNRDHLPKRDFTTLKTGETGSRQEERKNLSKALKV